jgi:hypothetical protein
MLMATVLKDVHQKLSKEQCSSMEFHRIGGNVVTIFHQVQLQVQMASFVLFRAHNAQRGRC